MAGASASTRALPGQALFRIWRGDAAGGEFQDYKTTIDPGMVVLDAVSPKNRPPPNPWNPNPRTKRHYQCN